MTPENYPVVVFHKGLTVRELKDYLEHIPDQNERGETNMVWLQSGNTLSSPAVKIMKCDRSDIILIYDDGED